MAFSLKLFTDDEPAPDMTPGLQRVAQKKQSFFDSSDFPDDLDLLRGGGSLASKEPELKEQSMGSHKDNGAHFRFDLEPGAWMFSHMDTGGFELKEPINSQSHFHEGVLPSSTWVPRLRDHAPNLILVVMPVGSLILA